MIFAYKHKLHKALILTILTIFLFSTGYSQASNQTVYLTLQSSIDRALQENNKIQLSHFSLKKAQWNKYQAWSQLFPAVHFSTRYMHIDEQTFAERDFRRYLPPEFGDQIPQTVFQESYYSAIDVSMPIFNGAIINGLKIANTNKNIANKINESTTSSILHQVVTSYLNLLKSKKLLELQKKFTDLAKLNFEKAQRQELAGRFSENEVLFWEIDYQKQRSALTSSKSALRTTETVLLNLLELEINAHIEVDNNLPKSILEKSDEITRMSDNQILDMVILSENELIKANAALSAALSQKQISKLMYRNTQSSFLPTVNLGYTYAWRENNTLELDDYSPETYVINLSIPLFTSLQNLSKVRSAYYEYRQNEENYQDQLNNTRFFLSEITNRIIELKTQLHLSKLNLKYSANNYRIIEQQKDRGLISNIDFINTKLSLQTSELDDINNQYDFISAIIEMYYLLGSLDKFLNIN